MALNEFSLIDYFFTKQQQHRPDVVVGIGDDAALVSTPLDQAIAVSTDTLVAGIHFLENTAPDTLGYKALAVNLSDMAAMGAEPAWVTLSLTLPEVNEAWLSDFARGFFTLADKYKVQLIGGDTTRGPLSITVQIHGFVPPNKALLRRGAKAGDKIYVTGTLGDAGLALQILQKKIYAAVPVENIMQRLLQPEPRVAVGLALRDLASSAIDISDGLAADLNHILTASGVGACIEVEAIPLSATVKKILSLEQAWQLALSAGDDYELCFTAPATCEETLAHVLKHLNCHYQCIGEIKPNSGLELRRSNGEFFTLQRLGFQHF